MSQGSKNSQNGVIEGSLQLDTYAEQGSWQIEVKGQIEILHSQSSTN